MVSPNSPLGQALIGRKEGERVTYDAPTGPLEKAEGDYRFAMAQDGPALVDVSMPLTNSRRSSGCGLAGASLSAK